MELGLYFISAILRDGRDALREAIDRGVTTDYLRDSAQTVYAFVLDYVRQYDALPTPLVIEGKTSIKVPDPQPNPYPFFIDELLNRKLHDALRQSVMDVMQSLEARDPRTAYTKYEEGLRTVRQLEVVAAKTESLLDLRKPFWDHYDLLEAGYRGIQTPWPSVNDATLGYWPEDFVLYVARLGVGKTWIVIAQADYAWSTEKRRVLVVTTEMSRLKIMQRWVAYHYHLAYDDVRKGQLSPYAKQALKQGLDTLDNAENLRIIGGDFDFRIESLEAAIEESAPEIVYIDGAYLLKIPGDNRFERAASTYDELKRMAKRYGIPVVATTQLNREAKANKVSSISAEKIALSDTAGWNADLIWGLIQTEEMQKNGEMMQKPLKFREGRGEEIMVRWDFAMMDFSEIPTGMAAAVVHPSPPLGGTGPTSYGSGSGVAGVAGAASGAPGGNLGGYDPNDPNDPNDPLPF